MLVAVVSLGGEGGGRKRAMELVIPAVLSWEGQSCTFEISDRVLNSLKHITVDAMAGFIINYQ